MATVKKCRKCGGEVTDEQVNVVITRNIGQVVYIGVIAGYCNDCGKIYYKPKSLRRFKEIERKWEEEDREAGTLT